MVSNRRMILDIAKSPSHSVSCLPVLLKITELAMERLENHQRLFLLIRLENLSIGSGQAGLRGKTLLKNAFKAKLRELCAFEQNGGRGFTL
jgi:hypothetical protein